MKKVLVVAAHLDDEILGCGGTLLKHAKDGDIVDVCIVTSPKKEIWTEEYSKKKNNQAKEVDKILGTRKRYYADFPSVSLNTISSADLNGKVGKIINDSDPDIIYTHHKGDINIDHRFVYEAVMVNTRPIDKKISVFCFETVSSTEWSNESFTPNFYVDVSEFLDTKIEMFYKYDSEVKTFPHPRSRQGIITLAKKRGMDICIHNAEAFQVARSYWV